MLLAFGCIVLYRIHFGFDLWTSVSVSILQKLLIALIINHVQVILAINCWLILGFLHNYLSF